MLYVFPSQSGALDVLGRIDRGIDISQIRAFVRLSSGRIVTFGGPDISEEMADELAMRIERGGSALLVPPDLHELIERAHRPIEYVEFDFDG